MSFEDILPRLNPGGVVLLRDPHAAMAQQN